MSHLFKLINNISMAINQHAVMINKQQSGQKKFVEESEVCSLFDKIAESVSLYDDEFIERLEIPGRPRSSSRQQVQRRDREQPHEQNAQNMQQGAAAGPRLLLPVPQTERAEERSGGLPERHAAEP